MYEHVEHKVNIFVHILLILITYIIKVTSQQFFCQVFISLSEIIMYQTIGLFDNLFFWIKIQLPDQGFEKYSSKKREMWSKNEKENLSEAISVIYFFKLTVRVKHD